MSGHGADGRDVGPGQERVEPAVGMALDDVGDDIGDVAPRLDAVQLAGLDQQGQHRPVVAAAVGAGEEGVLAVERDGPDGSLDDVGVHLDTAVFEGEVEPLPSGQRVADRLGQLALLADVIELRLEPCLQGLDDRPAALLAHPPALIGGLAADVGLHGIERRDAPQGLAGDRRRSGVSLR